MRPALQILRSNLTHIYLSVAFKVYDLNNDGNLSKDELLLLLRSSLPTEDAVKDLVDLLHKRLDIDRDGRVNLTDFLGAVGKEGLLRECLGGCVGKGWRVFQAKDVKAK